MMDKEIYAKIEKAKSLLEEVCQMIGGEEEGDYEETDPVKGESTVVIKSGSFDDLAKARSKV